jgi:hypothetical protein
MNLLEESGRKSGCILALRPTITSERSCPNIAEINTALTCNSFEVFDSHTPFSAKLHTDPGSSTITL